MCVVKAWRVGPFCWGVGRGSRRERSECRRAVRSRAGMCSVWRRWCVRWERVGGGVERRRVKVVSKAV